jgi:Peptidase A4 family
MRQTRTWAALATALAVGLDTDAARADPSSALVVSKSWAGYVATAPPRTPMSFTSVTGTWTVPAARCARRDRGASSAVWVGIGGYSSATPKVQQVGTDSNCGTSGKPQYFAWFEVVPYPAYPVAQKVRPGDSVLGSVRILAGSVELRLADRTRHWSFVRRISWPEPDTSSAEWVVEAPATCIRFRCVRPPLANFGSVTLSNVTAVANGRTGTLAASAWTVTPIRLVPVAETGTLGLEDESARASIEQSDDRPSSPAGATPALAADGHSFAISWVAVAPR